MNRSSALSRLPQPRVLAFTRGLFQSVAACGVVAMLASPAAAGPSESARARRAIEQARTLADLPSRVRVRAIDPELAADSDALQKLDAFVVRDTNGRLRPVIYLNARSEILLQAANGSELHTHLLAAVLVHEANHLAGGSEAEARRAEMAFIDTLVEKRRLPRELAGRYLQVLSAAARSVPDSTP